MHILVTNDDGPPSDHASPYVHPLPTALESHGHQVSVILPNTQPSWIGKSHIITDIHTTAAFNPAPSSSINPDPPTTWTLVNGTPASCIRLGLNNHQHAVPIDLVLSGPNFGKNTTAVFALSSGTIGAAMEAALCGKKAIAVSFVHAEDGTYDGGVVAEACEHAVRLAEHLYRTWDEDVHVYSVNVPLDGGERGDGEDGGKRRRRVVWTRVQQNRWGRGRAFREREGEAGEKEFEWAPPRFGGVAEGIAVSVAPEGSWVIRNGFTSVTPLRANFMHVTRVGELEF